MKEDLLRAAKDEGIKRLTEQRKAMGGDPDPKRCEEFIQPILRRFDSGDGIRTEAPTPKPEVADSDGIVRRPGDGEETALGRTRGVRGQPGWSATQNAKALRPAETIDDPQAYRQRLLMRAMYMNPEFREMINRLLSNPDNFKPACPQCKPLRKTFCYCQRANELIEDVAKLVKAHNVEARRVNLFSGGGTSVQERKATP